MDYIYSIVLGAIQGLTEFLPISSSAHLVILHQLIKSALLDSLTFDVILHAGTLLATLLFFRREVAQIFKGFFTTVRHFKISHNFNEQLPWLILIGTVPAVGIGYFYGDAIESFFRSMLWIVATLIFGSLLFLIYERLGRKNRNLESMNFRDTFLIGLAQVLAFLPGISRSGITIVAGLSLGFKRKEAARFSFLLSLPIVFGASLQKIAQLQMNDLNFNFISLALAGFLTSVLVGYAVIKYFIRFLEKHSLATFAFYRFVLAAVLIILFLI